MAMEITVQNDIENPFLERRDIKFTLTSDGATPKADDVRTALATKLKVSDKNILVEHIYQKMGLHESDCIAKVYKKPVVAEKEGEAKEGEEVKKSEPSGDAPVEEKKDVKAEAVAEEKKDAPAAEKQPEKAEEKEKEGAKAEEPAPEKAKEDKKE